MHVNNSRDSLNYSFVPAAVSRIAYCVHLVHYTRLHFLLFQFYKTIVRKILPEARILSFTSWRIQGQSWICRNESIFRWKQFRSYKALTQYSIESVKALTITVWDCCFVPSPLFSPTFYLFLFYPENLAATIDTLWLTSLLFYFFPSLLAAWKAAFNVL